MSEPQTKAGRMFAADPYDTPNPKRRLDYILAIEAEAIAQERERLAAAEKAYVNAYIEGRDAALREALVERIGDMVGRQAAADVVDAAFRAALQGADR